MNVTSEVPCAADATMRSGFLPDRIVHLHPTRLCNLACLHCYSESDPQNKATLDPAVLIDALGVLRAEGYEVVSLSGGEPLMYRGLRTTLERSRALGFRVTMVSNGLLATDRARPLLSLLDQIAISFDGMAASHNEMRGRPDAFERASAALERLAAEGIPVAGAISLTRDAISELPELADHLVGLGARMLQIRPMARAGRARLLANRCFYNASDFARLYLVVLALQRELPSDVLLHCDLAPAEGLWAQRDAYAVLLGNQETLYQEEKRPLAELVNPVVVTASGVLKPIAYDFDDRFDLGTLEDLSSNCLQNYKQKRLFEFQALIKAALASLQGRHELVDWFDRCTRMSESWDQGKHSVASSML